MNNKSSDSEETYKMTEEDYKSIGVNPLKINDREYFLNSPLPKRKALPAPLNPSPLDIMKASMNNSANRRVNEDFSYEDFSYENPIRIKNSSKLISPIVRKGSSSRSSVSTGDGDDDYGDPDGDYDYGDDDYGEPDGDDGDGKEKEYFSSPYDIENKFIVEMSKFNTKMNELYIFFKGKIKSNLKTISKQDIQDILKDMNQLDYNFTDVLHAIEDVDVFGIKNKNIRHQN